MLSRLLRLWKEWRRDFETAHNCKIWGVWPDSLVLQLHEEAGGEHSDRFFKCQSAKHSVFSIPDSLENVHYRAAATPAQCEAALVEIGLRSLLPDHSFSKKVWKNGISILFPMPPPLFLLPRTATKVHCLKLIFLWCMQYCTIQYPASSDCCCCPSFSPMHFPDLCPLQVWYFLRVLVKWSNRFKWACRALTLSSLIGLW